MLKINLLSYPQFNIYPKNNYYFMRPVIVRLLCVIMLLPVLTACQHHNTIYASDCNDGHNFTPVSLAAIVDSAELYNNKFVEVSGKFVNDKTTSVLVGQKRGVAITVDFSNECPLFLEGTRIGFFDYDNNSGQLTPVNNKMVKLRGEVLFHAKAKANQLKVSLAHISYVQF